MRYSSEKEIHEVIRGFEDATISRDSWKHAEHLTVALHYLSDNDIETATEKMRTGIFNLLRAFGVDLSVEMPYHETLTVFWMRAVADFNASCAADPLLERANALVETCDKDLPLRHYTRDYLFSDEARSRYVGPDIQSVDSARE